MLYLVGVPEGGANTVPDMGRRVTHPGARQPRHFTPDKQLTSGCLCRARCGELSPDELCESSIIKNPAEARLLWQPTRINRITIAKIKMIEMKNVVGG